MTKCEVCEHPKHDAIDAALDAGRSPNLVRVQFRLAQQRLAGHLAHRSAQGKGFRQIAHTAETRNHLPREASSVRVPMRSMSLEEFRGHSAYDVVQEMRESINHLPTQSSHVGGIVGQGTAHTDDPWRQIRYHVQAAASVWRDLEHEARNVERLTFLLQEAFRDEDMGL